MIEIAHVTEISGAMVVETDRRGRVLSGNVMQMPIVIGKIPDQRSLSSSFLNIRFFSRETLSASIAADSSAFA